MWTFIVPFSIAAMVILYQAVAHSIAAKETARAEAAKAEAARIAARYEAAAKEAEKAQKAAAKAAQPKRPVGRPRKDPAEKAADKPKRPVGRPRKNPVNESSSSSTPANVQPQPSRPSAEPAKDEQAPDAVNHEHDDKRDETIFNRSLHIVGNNIFRNDIVSFTGTIPGMTRKEAIQAVIANGGKAFETMPVSTNLLVVGENPGQGKLDKADARIGQVKKITYGCFLALLKAPLTLDIEEFPAYLRSKGIM